MLSLGRMIKDFRFAVRTLRKSPAFTIGTILILSLGIGANTAIFSLVYPILLRGLPYPHPEQLVMVWDTRPREGINQNVASPAEFLGWRERNTSFQALSGFTPKPLTFSGEPEPIQVDGAAVSTDFFDLFGVRAVLGRTFAPGEDTADSGRVLVLSHGLWQRRYGADPLIIGKTIRVDDIPFTAIGVLPESFRLPYVEAQAWIPMILTPAQRTDWPNHLLQLYGRLRPGISAGQARAEMIALRAQMAKEGPQATREHSVNLQPFREYATQQLKPALIALQAAVGLVLLIACANVANLLLARGMARNREMAVRRALGATRAHLIRQVLVEGATICGVAAILAVTLSSWTVDGLQAAHLENRISRPGIGRSSAEESLPTLVPGAVVNLPVLSFTAGVSLLTVMLFGLVPAVQIARKDLYTSMKEGARVSTSSVSRRRLSGALVVVEVSTALVLLAGAGLMIRTVLLLQTVRPGFDPHNVLTFRVALSPSKYKDPPQLTGFYSRLLDRLRALPGIETAGATTSLPLSGHDFRRRVEVEGRVASPSEVSNAYNRVYVRAVTPGYFETVHLNLRAGRAPAQSDGSGTQRIAWIDETAAKRYWPGENSLGRRLKFGDDERWRTIAGVVGDVKHWGLAKEVDPEVYVPYEQLAGTALDVALRVKTDPLAIAGAVRKAAAEIDPDQPITLMRTMDDYVESSMASERSSMLLLGVFGALALILAAGGIFSVASHVVTERTPEIGLRMAVGALQRDIVWMVLRQGMRSVLIGVAFGLAGSLAANQLLAKLLYGVKPADPLTLAAGAIVMATVALAANWLPAIRAARVDPVVALRHE